MHPRIPSSSAPARRGPVALLAVLAALTTACGEPPEGAPAVVAPRAAVEEDGVLSERLAVEGAGDGSPIFTLVEGPRHGTLALDPATGEFTYRPDPDWSGRDAFQVTASRLAPRGPWVPDAWSPRGPESAVATVELEVAPVNDPPLVQAKTLGTREDEAAGDALSALDVDGDPVTFALVVPPAHGSLRVSKDGEVSYRPDRDWNGTDEAVIQAADGAATSPPATLTLTVDPANDAPVAEPAAVEVAEDGIAIGFAAATDVDSPLLDLEIVSPPSHGTLELDALTGAWVYQPERDFHGQDGFSFAASDGEATSATAAVTLTVTPVNDAPVAHPQLVQVAEDGEVWVVLAAEDVDGDPLTFELLQAPAHGTVELDAAAGALRYRPAADYHGPDVVRFAASDGAASSAAAEATVAVAPVNDLPVPSPAAIHVDEDGLAEGTLAATDPDGDAVSFLVVAPPARGALELDAATGRYTYRPAADLNGPDSFRFAVTDGQASSAGELVAVEVAAVNDAPVIEALADVVSVGRVESLVQARASDVDGDALELAVSVADPEVGAARVDPATGALVLTAMTVGATDVTVTASDGAAVAAGTFRFVVEETSRTWTFDVAQPRTAAVRLANTASVPLDVVLTHNGATFAGEINQLVAEAALLPGEAEPLERKLWRYVRDTTYGNEPMVALAWQHDSVIFSNSIGFGFCDDVASVYASLARAAGFNARAWDLSGHVVPEVFVDGRWSMYDPDFAVYYETRDGRVSSVEELAGDRTLITSPQSPLPVYPIAYSDFFADLYATEDDNAMPTEWFFIPSPGRRFRLPPAANITWPGQWSAPPVTHLGNEVPVSAQLRLDLPAGFTGAIELPLLLWDAIGQAKIRVGGVDFDAGSGELTAALHVEGGTPDAISPVHVIESTGPVTLIYLLNPMRFSMSGSTVVTVRGAHAGAAQAELVGLDEVSRLEYEDVSAVRRPR